MERNILAMVVVIIIIVVIVVLIIGFLFNNSNQDKNQKNRKHNCDCLPVKPDPNQDVASPTELGKWGIAYQEFVVCQDINSCSDNCTTNTIRLSIWFPVKKCKTKGLPPYQYHFSSDINGDDTWLPIVGADNQAAAQLLSTITTTSNNAVDGTNLRPPKDNFPLMVFAHGTTASPYAYAGILEYLTSHGFIVVAPFQRGNTFKDVLFIPFAEVPVLALPDAECNPIFVDQFLFSLNWILKQNEDKDSKFYHSVDPNRIIGSGQSRGTVLSSIASTLDPRIKALVELNGPYADDPYDPSLVTVPFSTTIGQFDTLVTPDQTLEVYPLINSDKCLKYLQNVAGAGHGSFINPCNELATLINYYDALISNGFPPTTQAYIYIVGFINFFETQGCTPGFVDPDLALTIARNYFISFSLVFGAGKKSYLPFLSKQYFLSNTSWNLDYYDSCSETTRFPPLLTSSSTQHKRSSKINNKISEEVDDTFEKLPIKIKERIQSLHPNCFGIVV